MTALAWAVMLSSAGFVWGDKPLMRPDIAPLNGPPGEAATTEKAEDTTARIYVDDSFGSMDKLRVATRLESQKQTQLAIQKYQEVLDEFGQKLMNQGNDTYLSLSEYVRAKLLAMPAVQKGMYDQLFGPQAKRKVDEAIAHHDLRKLLEVCDQYYPASSTVAGLQQAGEWYFEAGEFASAGRVWKMLLKHPRLVVDRGQEDSPAGQALAQVLYRGALAEFLAAGGRKADPDSLSYVQAMELKARLTREFPNATAPVNGQMTNLADNLESLWNKSITVHETLNSYEWPAFQGGQTRTHLLNVEAEAGARLWGVDLTALSSTRGSTRIEGAVPQAIINPNASQVIPPNALNSHAVMSNGVLYLNTPNKLLAINANAGTLLWQYPQKDLESANSNTPANYREYGTDMTPAGHYSCVVEGNEVLGILPAQNNNSRMNRRITYYYGGNLTPTRLVLLNRSTGKESWSVNAYELPLSEKGELQFVGAPILTGDAAYVLARKMGSDTFTQLYLVRMDRQSGKLEWSTYICSVSSGGYYNALQNSGGIGIPTLVDDQIFVSTGMGADCAIDVNTGRIKWLQLTEQAHRDAVQSRYMFQNNGYNRVVTWTINAPLVWRDQIITAESGSNIRWYNRETGRLVRSEDPKNLGRAELVLGVVDDTLITVGEQICGSNMLSGKPAWPMVDIPTEAGDLRGRPFLSQHYLYLPMEKGMLIVDVRPQGGGGTPRLVAWPKIPKNKSEDMMVSPGNLLITNEQVVVVNDNEIAGYSKWETARDRRLADIHKNPSDPKPYMDLGEVAYRTGHFEMAQENIQQAVRLALAQNPLNEEFVDKIYRMNLLFAQQCMGRQSKQEKAQARFYFAQCALAGRTPENQLEWRLVMAPLALQEQKPEEAARLYQEILENPERRTANFSSSEGVSRGGLAAESRMRDLITAQGKLKLNGGVVPNENDEVDTKWTPGQIEQAGREVIYKAYEQQAQNKFQLASTQNNLDGFRDVLAQYPNSMAAFAAVDRLATALAQSGKDTEQITLLRWAYRRSNDPEKLSTLAGDLCQLYLNAKKVQLANMWLERGEHLVSADKKNRFQALRAEILKQIPELAVVRDPRFNLIDLQHGGTASAPAEIAENATLLIPLEGGGLFRRPNLVATYDAHVGNIRIVQTPGLEELGNINLEEADRNGTVNLLGYVRDAAILAVPNGALALNVRSGKLEWEIKLEPGVEDRTIYRNLTSQLNAFNARRGMISEEGGISPIGTDVEKLRVQQFLSKPDNATYTTMRIIGGRLVVLTGTELRAYDLRTGKLLWMPVRLPENLFSMVVTGNEEYLAVQSDSLGSNKTRFTVINAATGSRQRSLNLDGQTVFWRSVSDDGSLYCASNTSIAAYELGGDVIRPRWRRDDVKTTMPTACLLTIDGMVLVDTNNDLLALTHETGEFAWNRSQRINLAPNNKVAPGTPSAMGISIRSGNYALTSIDGDNINVMTATDVSAYRIRDGSEAWQSAMRDIPDKPPLMVYQVANPYLVVFASGTTPTAQRAVNFYLINRINPKNGELTNGKLEASPQLRSRGDGLSNEGPMVSHWQAVDGGIVVEIGQQIRLIKPVKPIKPQGK